MGLKAGPGALTFKDFEHSSNILQQSFEQQVTVGCGLTQLSRLLSEAGAQMLQQLCHPVSVIRLAPGSPTAMTPAGVLVEACRALPCKDPHACMSTAQHWCMVIAIADRECYRIAI